MASVLHLSSVAGSPLLDSAGSRLGRVEDVIARLDTADRLPPVTGLKARIGGRELFVPADRLASVEPPARTSTTKLNLARFERRPGEVLLREDLLGRDLINVTTARLVTAREVELVCDDGVWRVAGIDPTLRARFRRLWPRHFRSRGHGEPQLVAWTDLEPFVGHVPGSRLRLRRLVRLHPAQIADLVEAASHDEGEEIMKAVGHDKELEADVFEELDDEHQIEFLRERSDAEVAAVLARMESDDAADLLLELEQERRLPVLELMPAGKREKIRRLLSHNPQTAGGMMNPDFLSVAEDAIVEQALDALRRSELPAEQLQTVLAVDAADRLVGAVTAAALVKAGPGETVASLTDGHRPSVTAEADLPEVALLMSDFNLVSIPVVDGEGRVLGVVTVDDVVEHLLPADWRRRYGPVRD